MEPYCDPNPIILLKSFIYPWLIITFLVGVFILILTNYLDQKLDPKNKNNTLLPRRDFIQNDPPRPLRKFLIALSILFLFCTSWAKEFINYYILRKRNNSCGDVSECKKEKRIKR